MNRILYLDATGVAAEHLERAGPSMAPPGADPLDRFLSRQPEWVSVKSI